jgi:hypothetical protein
VQRQRVGHRLDAALVDFVDLLDVLKNRPQLRGQFRELILAQRQPRQLGDMANLIE